MKDDDLSKNISGLLGGNRTPKTPQEIARDNDKRLMEMSTYDVTKGYTVNMDIDPDKLASLMNEKFTYLKGQVKTGEFTITQLEADIYERWGIIDSTPEASKLTPAAPEPTPTPEQGSTISKPITGFGGD
jgi:hypothetical protein